MESAYGCEFECKNAQSRVVFFFPFFEIFFRNSVSYRMELTIQSLRILSFVFVFCEPMTLQPQNIACCWSVVIKNSTFFCLRNLGYCQTCGHLKITLLLKMHRWSVPHATVVSSKSGTKCNLQTIFIYCKFLKLKHVKKRNLALLAFHLYANAPTPGFNFYEGKEDVKQPGFSRMLVL